MKAFIFAVLAVLIGFASPATAEGLGGKSKVRAAQQAVAVPAEPAKVASWTGPYIGLHAGLAATSTDVGGMAELSGDGTQLGINAGYDVQMGKAVTGVWGEYTWADIQTSFGGANTTLKGQYAGGLLLGYLVTDRLLAYVKGGWTQVDASSNFASMPTFDGYVYGGGLKAKLDENFAFKLEYLATELKAEKAGGASFEPDSHAVRIGGEWRFNFPTMTMLGQ